jgi:Taurine catabolism dioxygenase TauD, TfdA family
MHVLTEVVSHRGVVFLRNQDVTPQQMKELCLRITEAAGSV